MNSLLGGAQAPHVAHVPPAAGSEAAHAAKLAADYGLTPDPWQMTVLEGWLGTREDGRWSSPRCGLAVPRQNGKNGVAEVFELFCMIFLSARILHTAHEVKTARKAFARLLEFFDNERQYPELKALVREIRRTNGQEAIVLRNGGSVEFIARSRGSGRGFSVDTLVMDEAQELSEDAYAALLPTISASDNPQQIVMGTPPGPSAIGEVFTRVRSVGVRGEDERLCWLEWGCEPGVDLDDREMWQQANPALGIRLGWETVADERASMDDEMFARERLGVWIPREQQSSVVDLDVWLSLADPDVERGARVVFGVDVDEGRAAAVGVAWARPDGLTQAAMVESALSTGQAHDRLVELSQRWGGRVVLGGPAAGLEGDLARAGVQVQVCSSSDFSKACGAFADAVSQRTLRHRGEPDLTASVQGARWRSVGTSGERAWQLKDAAGVGPLAAVTRALWGQWTAPTYDPLDSIQF